LFAFPLSKIRIFFISPYPLKISRKKSLVNGKVGGNYVMTKRRILLGGSLELLFIFIKIIREILHYVVPKLHFQTHSRSLFKKEIW